MKKYLITIAILFPAIIFSQGQDAQPATRLPDFSTKQLAMPPAIPTTFNLFGEAVPLQVQDVKERFDRELLVNTYMQGSNLYILKLTTRWLPMIEKKLIAAGIPEDFKYLCIAESALQNLISKAGATGFWQFMRNTGPGYGLEINSHVDERYHPEKSTDAAIKYLKTAYEKFGNWTAAAASYNCGVGGYNQRAIQQGTTNYYDLFLPEETMRYIFRIMALKHIVENPEANGFSMPAQAAYQPFDLKEIPVTTSISSLVNFARENNTDYKTIRLLNPWLRSSSLPVRAGKRYIVLVPVK